MRPDVNRENMFFVKKETNILTEVPFWFPYIWFCKKLKGLVSSLVGLGQTGKCFV